MLDHRRHVGTSRLVKTDLQHRKRGHVGFIEQGANLIAMLKVGLSSIRRKFLSIQIPNVNLSLITDRLFQLEPLATKQVDACLQLLLITLRQLNRRIARTLRRVGRFGRFAW